MNANKNCPENFKLKNEVGKEYNDFCIIRGKSFIKFGKDVWIGYFTFIDGTGGLEIGSKVSISNGVHIYTHDSSNYRRYDLVKDVKTGTHLNKAPVKIGDNVQIGANSIVLPGVSIGSNVIVGALSLVNRDIPDNCTAYGSPIMIKNGKGETG